MRARLALRVVFATACAAAVVTPPPVFSGAGQSEDAPQPALVRWPDPEPFRIVDDVSRYVTLKPGLPATFAPHPLSFGPFSMDFDNDTRPVDGRQAHFAHVHVEDMRLLGGDVSGRFDGRTATIQLSWPTNR